MPAAGRAAIIVRGMMGASRKQEMRRDWSLGLSERV